MAAALLVVEEKADDAKSALLDLFRETTQGEADAEAALDALKLEAAKLEAKTRDLTGAEQTRLNLLNDELIPAQRGNLNVLRLEKTALESLTKSQEAGLPTWDKQIRRISTATIIADSYKRSLLGIPSTVTTEMIITGAELTRALLAGPAIARQHGGPFAARQAVLVGERGPEMAVFNQPGTILPDAGAALGGLSADGLSEMLSGLTIELDGEVIGRLIDSRVGARADLLIRGG